MESTVSHPAWAQTLPPSCERTRPDPLVDLHWWSEPGNLTIMSTSLRLTLRVRALRIQPPLIELLTLRASQVHSSTR